MTEFQAMLIVLVLLTFTVMYLLVKIHLVEAMIWRSPPRERYTRASVTIGKIQVDAGLEWREEDAPIVGHDLWQVCKEIVQRAHFIPPMQALISAEPTLERMWPDRAWFLEIGDPDGTSYSQTYQPWGKPRWRYDSTKRWWQVWRGDEEKAA